MQYPTAINEAYAATEWVAEHGNDIKVDGTQLAAGVAVTAVRYNGMIHDFGLLNAISQTPGTQAAIAQVADELKKHLQ